MIWYCRRGQTPNLILAFVCSWETPIHISFEVEQKFKGQKQVGYSPSKNKGVAGGEWGCFHYQSSRTQDFWGVIFQDTWSNLVNFKREVRE